MHKKNSTEGILSKFKDSRILWACLSLLAAFLIWVYYTSNYGADIERTFYGVEVTYSGESALRDSLNLVISQEETTSVNLTLSGPRRELAKLTSADIKAVVNLSNVTREGYRTMSYTPSYPSSVNTASIQVTGQSPQTVGLYISKLATKVVEFQGTFEGSVREGYAVDSSHISFDPATITLIGPEEELEQIHHAHVYISRDEVTSSFTVTANYSLVNGEGELLEFTDVQTDAETVMATVPISMKKEVALDVTLVNGGGAIAENVIKNIEPKTITLIGDASTLEGINTISLDTIDLSDYSAFPKKEYTIVLPNGTESLSGVTTATVELTFTGLADNLYTVSNLDYINLEEGYSASIMTSSLVVKIRAPEDVLDSIGANNIRAVADLTGLTTTSRAPVTIYVDGFEQAGAVGDFTLYVEITPED